MLSFPGDPKYGQNLALIKETITEDWYETPSTCSDVKTGYEGLRSLLALYSNVFFDFNIERNETYVIGNKVIVLSKIKAILIELPPGYTEYPMFPGVDPEKISGNSFISLKHISGVLLEHLFTPSTLSSADR